MNAFPFHITTERLLLISVIITLQACSNAYRLDSAQSSLRSSFAARDYDQSVKLLDKLSQNKVYQNKDAVLLNLEQATALHFAGQYQASNASFTSAEDKMNELFTKSISRGVQSFVVNDNTLAYDGEDYEDVYLNVFKSLNYLHMDDLEAALVEARRVSHKLSQLNIKYKGLVEALSKADTTKHTDWRSGKSNVQNSALAHYLSTVLFAKSNKPDDARISYENMRKAFQDQPPLYTAESLAHDQWQKITQPEEYNVLVAGFSGRAPQKRQTDVRLWLDDPGMYLKFSLPSLRRYPSQVRYVKISVDDSLLIPLTPIEEMDLVAQEIYKVKEPIIYARTFVRSFLKALGTRALSKKAEKKSSFLGGLTEVLGIVGQELTEKADLRGWQTMPARAYVTVFKLPAGTHQFDINYYATNGELVFTEKQTATISDQNKLTLIESLYWN